MSEVGAEDKQLGGRCMFVLVRHGLAGEKGSWHGPDEQRPLTAVGQVQALGLVESLGGLGLRALWSSPTDRCRQTLVPLATRLGLPVQDIAVLSTDAEVDHLLAFLSSREASGAALCTHGEVISKLFARWRDQVGYEIRLTQEEPDNVLEKGAAVIVEGVSDSGPLLRHIPPAT